VLLGLVSLSMLFDSRQGFRLCLPLNECFKHYGSAMIAPPRRIPARDHGGNNDNEITGSG